MGQFQFTEFKDFYAYHAGRDLRGGTHRKADTLAVLAKKLGYNSPSLFSMIAKGKRLPSPTLLDALLEAWQIPSTEREAVRLQVEIERRTRRNQDVLQLVDRLRKVTGAQKFFKLNIDQYEVVRNWYNYVLKELIGTPNFNEDATELSRVLRNKVTPSEIKKGIQALLSAGLVRRNTENHKLEPVVAHTETSNGTPSEAIQEHHNAMLDRAKESIKEQEVSARHLNSLTLRFDPNHMAEVGSRIEWFVKQINEDFGSGNSGRIFQLNVQFFEHTKPYNGGDKK